MRIQLGVAVALSIILIGTTSAQAQDGGTRSGSGVDVRVSPGIAYEGAIFGDDSPLSRSNVAFTIGGQIRGQVGRRTGIALDASIDTKAQANPHFDERLRALSILVGPEIGRGTYVRPTAGLAIQSWSGTRSCQCLGTALAVGVAVGREAWNSAKYRVTLELVARASIAHGVATWQVGVQVPIGTVVH